MMLAAVMALSMLAGACAAPGGGSSAKAAVVNGTVITVADYDKQVRLMQDYMVEQGLDIKTDDGKAAIDQLRVDILNQMIDSELIRQAAKAEGVAVTDAEVNDRINVIKQDAGGDEAFKANLKQAKLTEADFRNLIVRDQMIYEKLYAKVTKSLATTVEQVKSRHILVNTEKEATDLLDRLQKGADFAALAKESSLDTGSKENGGELDFFPRGVLDTAFEELIFRLKVNELGIAKSDFGYHVVQVLAREANRALAPEIVQVLAEEVMNTYIEGLRDKATIERIVQLPPTPTTTSQ
jgi:peptidyl-prolyl cis-trans isomerase C